MTATLKPALPAGTILAQHVDQDFADFVAGRPVTQRVILSVVQTGAISSGNQEKGRVNTSKYETVHAVEITDAHKADELRHLLTAERANRGLLARQPALFDATEDEQRESLLDMIRDHASEQDIPMAELDAQWVTYFGGPEHANSETVQASRSVAQLKEFAYSIGAIADSAADEPAVTPPAFSDSGVGDDGDEDLDES